MAGEEEKEETVVLKVPMKSADSRYKIAQLIRSFGGLELIGIEFDNKKVTVKGKKIDKEKLLRKLSLSLDEHVHVWPEPVVSTGADTTTANTDANTATIVQVYHGPYSYLTMAGPYQCQCQCQCQCPCVSSPYYCERESNCRIM